MANQGGTHDQHVKAGQKSHKGSDDKMRSASASDKGGKQGGSPDQHMKSGQQGHKNKH